MASSLGSTWIRPADRGRRTSKDPEQHCLRQQRSAPSWKSVTKTRRKALFRPQVKSCRSGSKCRCHSTGPSFPGWPLPGRINNKISESMMHRKRIASHCIGGAAQSWADACMRTLADSTRCRSQPPGPGHAVLVLPPFGFASEDVPWVLQQPWVSPRRHG